MLRLKRLSAKILSWTGLVGLASCGQPSPLGEVVLRITTDLAVPQDANTLHIVVKRGGASETILDQAYPLLAASALGDSAPGMASLPGTYALVSSNKTGGQLNVHLELLQGGANGSVRVERDAELEIPREGVKELTMPLNFLCAPGNLPDGCGSDTTCQPEGTPREKLCLDQTFPLFDYSTVAPSACFDVAACFESASTIAPESDMDLGCSIKGAGRGVDVNVALIVNASAVGNYGVCGPLSGKCLVPLDHDTGGWQTLVDSNNQPIAIGLPEAVCSAFRASSIEGVAVAATACAPKSASAGLCAAAGGCFPATGICPSGWHGYSCSGNEQPKDSALFCEKVGTDATLGGVIPGLWCCGGGYSVQSNSLLIDDMSSGPQIKLPPQDGVPAGLWWAAADNISAVISPPPYPALFTQRAIDPPVTPLGGPTIRNAACLRSEGFNGDWAGEGFNFRQTSPVYSVLPFDVSPFTGIRFWASAAASKIPGLPTAIRVTFPDTNTFSGNADSTCVKGAQPCDPFGEDLILPEMPDWKRYTIKWTDPGFGQSADNYGQDRFEFNHQVYETIFATSGPRLPFDFCIAQIEFIVD